MIPKIETGTATEIRIRRETGTGNIAQDLGIEGKGHALEVEIINAHDHEVVRNTAVKGHHQGIKSHQNPVEEKRLCTGMCHLQGLSIFHLFSIKQCKVRFFL